MQSIGMLSILTNLSRFMKRDDNTKLIIIRYYSRFITIRVMAAKYSLDFMYAARIF